MSCQNDSFFTMSFCNKVFCKITHLEPHPTSHMIHFYYRNRTRLMRNKLQFLFDIDRLTLSIERDFQSVVRSIESRTDKNYYSKKLTRQEMWVLNERKTEAYNKFVSAREETQIELSKLYEKLDGCNDIDHKEYYEERIERINYYVSICKELYLDFKEKIQEHNR